MKRESSWRSVKKYLAGMAFLCMLLLVCSVWNGEAADTIPVITEDLRDGRASLLKGITVRETIEATGTNLEYQWYWSWDKEGNQEYAIDGANTNSYSIKTEKANHGKYFYCKVSNGAGTVVSKKIYLVVADYVYYDANGGKNAPLELRTECYTEFNISKACPSRVGYTFLGWSTSADGEVKYEPGATMSIEGRTWLYAIWKEGAAEDTQPCIVKEMDDAGRRILTGYNNTEKLYVECAGTNLNYQWYYTEYDKEKECKIEGATENIYAFQVTEKMAGKDYYCKIWNSKGSVTSQKLGYSFLYYISYDANEGESAPGRTQAKYPYECNLSNQVPKRTGYTFVGWSTEKDGAVQYTSGARYRDKKSVTLYAVWKEGETDDSAPVITKNISSGSFYLDYNQKEELSVECTGTNLKYQWYSSNDYAGTEETVLTGETTSSCKITINRNTANRYYYCRISNSKGTVITAKRCLSYMYKISYDANGGENAPAYQLIYYPETAVISSEIPVKEGYTFLGWTTSMDGDAEYKAGDIYDGDTSAILRAVWEKNEDVVPVITKQPSSVIAHGDEVKTFSVETNISDCRYQWYEAESETAEGVLLSGETNATLSVSGAEHSKHYFYCVVSNANGTCVSIRADFRVSYRIAFDTNGGDSFEFTTVAYYNDKVSFPGRETWKGHIFLGWADSREAAKPKYYGGDVLYACENRTFYAVWKLESYTISYDANGGTGAPDSQTKYYGENLVLGKSIPVKENHSFIGWAASADATEPDYAPEDIYTADGDATLYAVWAEEADTAPVITKQPQQVKAHTGEMIQFSIEATGNHLSYQWYYYESEQAEEEIPISGARKNTYECKVTGSMAGRLYYCKVSNSVATVNSHFTGVTVQYTVRFDTNGGSGAPKDQYQTQNMSIWLSKVEPVREEYRFVGWSLSKIGTAVYLPGSEYQGNMDITLYAVWEKIKETERETEPDTPSTEPDTPSTEPDTPSTEPDTTPSTKPTTPATEPTTPSTPATEPTTPSTPATEPTTPSTPATEPTTPTTPATEPTMPSTPSTEPSTPATEPTTPSAPATNPPTPSPAPSQPSVTPPSGTVNSQTAQPVSNGKKTITRKYKKNQKFSLGVKVTGKTTYKTSNKKVVAVDKKGKAQIKGCGRATVTIKQKGKAAQKVYITIIPSAVSVSAKSPKAGQMLISWKKNSSASGYQIQYSEGKEFAQGVTRTGTTKSNKLTKTTVKNLKRGTTYYVRVRTYKKASGGKVYSAWSKVKAVRIK